MGHAALSGKRILVTAGPTWVALDDIRVISNISTGALGLMLAQKAAQQGARVDLLLGPVENTRVSANIKVTRFKFFNEFKTLLEACLKRTRYDVILHAAAVSDYLFLARPGKISSDNKSLFIKLARAPKLIDSMRRMNPGACLVMFKLEAGVTDGVLIDRSRRSMKKSKADLVVANRFKKGAYRGFILDQDKVSKLCLSRESLSDRLFKIIRQKRP